MSEATAGSDEPTCLVIHQEVSDTGARRLALLFRVRWLCYIVCVLGLLAIGLGCVNGLRALLMSGYWFPVRWWNMGWSEIGRLLPAYGVVLTILGGAGFAGASLATWLGQRRYLPGGEEEDGYAPLSLPLLSWLHQRRLVRLGFWSLFLVAAVGALLFLLGMRPLRFEWWLGMVLPHVATSGQIILPAATLFTTLLGVGALAAGAQVPTRVTGKVRRALGQTSQREVVPALTGGNAAAETSREGRFEVVEACEAAPSLSRCPVCGVAVGDAPTTCPRCHVPHHSECWDYAGGCAIFGCDSRGWRQPTEPVAFDRIRRRTQLWIALFRLNWGSFCVATLGMVLVCWGLVAPSFPTWGGSELVACLALLTRAVFHVGTWMAAVGVAAYLLLLLPMWLSARHLRRLGSEPVQPTRDAGRSVLDHLETPPAEATLHAAMVFAAGTTGVLMCVLPLLRSLSPEQWRSAITLGQQCGGLTLGLLFLLGVYGASRSRSAYIQSMRNRLEASFLAHKGDKHSGPTIPEA